MPKGSNYPIHVGVKISKDQERKILESGMSKTEFIREAIDFYDNARLNSYTELKLSVIGECIQALNVYSENVKNSRENTFNKLMKNVKSVKQNSTETLNKTHNLLNKSDENVKQIKYVKQDLLNKSDENIKQTDLEEQKNPYKKIENTLIRLIKNKGQLSDQDYKFQAERINKKASDVKKYVFEHHEFLEQEAQKLP